MGIPYLYNQPCSVCGSSDARTYYRADKEGGDDNWTCFSCNTSGFVTDKHRELNASHRAKVYYEQDEYLMIHQYPVLPLEARGISQATAKLFGVHTRCSEDTGEADAYYYPFYNKEGELTAYKERILPKSFRWTASPDGIGLFGQNLSNSGGRLVIVTEGMDDCMAGYELLQAVGKNYRIVSLPNGVSSIKKHLEYLNTFETVMLCFDTDKAGIEASIKSAELFKPGKAKVVKLPNNVKDVNDLLKDSKSLLEGGREFLSCINNANIVTPVGIVELSSTWDTLFAEDSIQSIPYPWNGVNDKLYGLRPKELITITAGSGLGKSAVVRELEHWLLMNTQDNIGILALEEDVARTAWGVMSIEANVPLHIREERKDITEQEIRGYFDKTMGTGRLFTLDHFGSTQSETLLNKIRFMVNGLDCKWIFLDHLSIVVSGMEDAGGNERIVIDKLMTDLRSLVQETGCGMVLVSHLRRTGGDKGHEKGEEVSLSHLRGSQSIAQLSDTVLALERNQQDTDAKAANTTHLRVLKNRYAGITGLACDLLYDKGTGRLSEVDPAATPEEEY